MKAENNAIRLDFSLFRKKRNILITILILIILISIWVVYNSGLQHKKNEVMEVIPSFYPIENLEIEESLDFVNAEILNNVLGYETVYKVNGDSATLGTAYYYFIKNIDGSYELLCSAYAMDINEIDVDSDGMAEIVADVYSVSPNIYLYAIQNGNVVYSDLQESARVDYVEFNKQTGTFLSHIKVNGKDHTCRLNLLINN